MVNINNVNGFIAFEGLDGSGKTSLINRLHNILVASGKKVYSFSISDLTKTGQLDKQVEINYQDILDFDKIREEQTILLGRLKEQKDKNQECILTYDKLMINYFSIGRIYSRIIKRYLQDGFIVLADRWFISTLAYNNIIYGSYISKLINYNKANPNRFMKVDTENDIDMVNRMINYIKPDIENILVPDLFVYLDITPKVAMERINNREKTLDSLFESEQRLTAVKEGFDYVFNTYTQEKKDREKYLFNMKDFVKLDGTNDYNISLEKIIRRF